MIRLITRFVGHYYFLLNGEFIVDKCTVDQGQSIDGIYIRKLNYIHVDIQTDSFIFQGDVVYNMLTKKFEIISHSALRRNFIFQKGVRNIFNISDEDCLYIYEQSL